ncbi:MAG: histidinol-phosphatase [Rectinemataceae bacterium]
MAWTNYHGHCLHCDGSDSARSIAEKAIERGFLDLGFSSHAPLPFPTPWCIGRGTKPAALWSYRREIESLRGEYRGTIEIHAGLEVDYLPGSMGPADPLFASFDYTIGSVHFVGRGREGSPWAMDDSPESFERGLVELFGGDIRALASVYYGTLRDMLERSRPTIVGHFDLVKKYNRGGKYFDEKETWYRALVEESLAAVARSGCILELNTGGMARLRAEEPYPSLWTLGRCRELGIPMTIDSDCHRCADVDHGFAFAADALATAGYGEVAVLEDRRWRPRPLRRSGIDLRPTTRRSVHRAA